MSDSTIGILIEKKDKPSISVKDLVGGGYYTKSHVEVDIDMKDLHFSLSLPKGFLWVLKEKIREYLDEKEEETRNGAESEETSVHAQKDRKEIKEKILLGVP